MRISCNYDDYPSTPISVISHSQTLLGVKKYNTQIILKHKEQFVTKNKGHC